MPFNRIARVSIGKTNQSPCDLIDVARRQVDHLGPLGMRAKRGQTDQRFLEEGSLSFVFPDRAMRDLYVARVEAHCHPAVMVELFRSRRAG